MRAKEELPECPVATAVSLIGGKWKLLFLRNLKERPWRFNELQRSIDGISQKVLTDSLRPVSYTHLDVYKRQGHHSFPVYRRNIQKSDRDCPEDDGCTVLPYAWTLSLIHILYAGAVNLAAPGAGGQPALADAPGSQ